MTDSATFSTPEADDEDLKEDLDGLPAAEVAASSCLRRAAALAGLGLSVAEVAFYDALANNQSAQDLMGDEVLMTMARELADKLRGNLSIDWQYKENVRARLRTMIKALLKRYKYPPDQEATAIDLVLQQTEMISEEWSREDLGKKIQAVVSDVLEKQF
jgi:type I restriction enzyme R subunit